MPDRIIRDELLRSVRYRELSSDTLRTLFVHLLLTVDSLGNAEATRTALCDCMKREVTEDVGAKWLAELADVDLIRVYVIEGKRYVHIPRFRQRLRYYKRCHPRPPAHIECKEIRALLEKVSLQSGDGQSPDRLESVEGKGSEGSTTTPPLRGAPPAKKSKGEGKTPRGTRLPRDWVLTKRWGDWAKQEAPNWDPERVRTEAVKFRNHWTSAPGRKGIKVDWFATWQNWVLNALRYDGKLVTGGTNDAKNQRRVEALRDFAGDGDAAGFGEGGEGRGRIIDVDA